MQATGSVGSHFPEKIPDRSAGGGAEKGTNYKSKKRIIREKLDLKPQKGIETFVTATGPEK